MDIQNRYNPAFLNAALAFNFDESENMPPETNGVLRNVLDFFYKDDETTASRIAETDDVTARKLKAGVIDSDLIKMALPKPSPVRRRGDQGSDIGKVIDLITSTPAKAAMTDVALSSIPFFGDFIKSKHTLTEDAFEEDELALAVETYKRVGAGVVTYADWNKTQHFGESDGTGLFKLIPSMLDMNPASRMASTIGAGKFEVEPNGDVILVDQYDMNIFKDKDGRVLTTEEFEKEFSGVAGLARAWKTVFERDDTVFDKIHQIQFLIGSRDYEDDTKDTARKVRINLGNPNAYKGVLPRSLENFTDKYAVNRTGDGGYTLVDKADSPSFIAEFADEVSESLSDIGLSMASIGSILSGDSKVSSVFDEPPAKIIKIAANDLIDNDRPTPRPSWFEDENMPASFPATAMDDERKGLFDMAMEAIFPSAQAAASNDNVKQMTDLQTYLKLLKAGKQPFPMDGNDEYGRLSPSQRAIVDDPPDWIKDIDF